MPGPQKSLTRFFKKAVTDQRGVIIVMFALMIPIMLGFIGLGVEVGYWYSKNRDLQAAADAAALAGGYEVYENRSTQTKTVADREAGNNGWDSTAGTSTVNNSQFNGTFPTGTYTTSYAADTAAVEVTLTETVQRMFSGWFMNGNLTLTAVAVATQSTSDTVACILALGSANGSGALNVQGSAAVTMSGCAAASNSTNANGITTTAGLTVDCLYSAGGVSGTATTTECASAKTYQAATVDPYLAIVTAPVPTDFDNCGSDGSNADGGDYVGPNADDTINPGVYCDIKFSRQNKTLTMNAGTYYIDRGDLTSTGGTIDATAGVTIVFGDNTGAGACGQIKLTGNSNINITAPTTGNFSGMAFYSSYTCDPNKEYDITGNNNSTIVGAMYNPNGEIELGGNGTVSGTCLQLISDTIKITGNGSIGSACDTAGTTSVSTGTIVSLVE
ncbi:MAG: pilus assembly protein [Rhodospirillales bacterium]|nr:pilus assembly protein [Rhodospirillales bacterium]